MILDIERSPDHMWQLKSTIVDKFGYDQSGTNRYRFNAQGYRSDIDFDFDSPCLVTIGPSISFGIGIPIEKTFSFQLAQSLRLANYNFSVGCYRHTSMDYVGLLTQLATKPNIKAMVINWNNLSRVRTDNSVQDDHNVEACISRLANLLNFADKTVCVPCLHILFDPDRINLPRDLQRRLLIYNQGVVDHSPSCGDQPAFGVKTNAFIYKALLSKTREFYHSSR
jgi:hypothetical protein